MIIECKNCLKKFIVRDSDIPIKGRTVQCSNCSTQWFQVPITSTITTDNLNIQATGNSGIFFTAGGTNQEEAKMEVKEYTGSPATQKTRVVIGYLG